MSEEIDFNADNEDEIESLHSKVSEENNILTADSDDECMEVDELNIEREKFQSIKPRSLARLRHSKPLSNATLNPELAEVLRDFGERFLGNRDNVNIEMCRNRFTQEMTAKKLHPGHDSRRDSSDHLKGYDFFLNLKNKTLLYTETSKQSATLRCNNDWIQLPVVSFSNCTDLSGQIFDSNFANYTLEQASHFQCKCYTEFMSCRDCGKGTLTPALSTNAQLIAPKELHVMVAKDITRFNKIFSEL